MIRYGYACVNQTLTSRPKKLGGRVTTSRTARKASWYPDNLQLISDKALDNAKDLLTYLQWKRRAWYYFVSCRFRIVSVARLL